MRPDWREIDDMRTGDLLRMASISGWCGGGYESRKGG